MAMSPNSQKQLYEDGCAYHECGSHGEAARIFAELAKQGYAKAQNDLGMLFFDGLGVDRNKNLAAKWFKEASLKGNRTAQYNLAGCYESGDGVEKDLVQAHLWYSLASNAGDDNAIAALENLKREMSEEQITWAEHLVSIFVYPVYDKGGEKARPKPLERPAHQETPANATGFAYDKFTNFRNRLLDKSGRNRLLNYNHPASSCIRIVDELPDQLFFVLKSGKKLDFLPVDQPKERELLEAGYQVIDSDASQIGKKPEIPSAEVWAKHLGFDTNYELPETDSGEKKHSDTSIQTLLYEAFLDARLRHIKSRADTALNEGGINVLYLALGFLEWYERDDSNRSLLSPLFTVPVTLHRDRDTRSGRYKYFISLKDESLLTNLSLRERFVHDFGLLLPEIDEDESTPEAYFEQVKKRLANSPLFSRWKIRRFATLCLLNFSKQVIFNDLKPDNWEQGSSLAQNSILGRIFSNLSVELPTNENETGEPYEIDRLPNLYELFPLIADADSSQHSALIDAVQGKDLVIVGPPGTGKSQTITNLIAACIANGKKVLFVAEKMAALNVVKDRLEKSGLGNFCLEIHSHKTNKAEIAKNLGESLEQYGKNRPVADVENQIDILKRYTGQLNDYVREINSVWKKTGLTLHEIFCRVVHLRESHQADPQKIKIPSINVETITRADIREIQDTAAVLESLHRQVAKQTTDGKIISHYWCGLGDSHSTQQIVPILEQWTNSLERLMEEWRQVSVRLFFEADRSITIEDIGEFIKATEALPSLKEPRLLPDFVMMHENREQIENWFTNYQWLLSDFIKLSSFIKHDEILNAETLDIIKNAIKLADSTGIAAGLKQGDIDQDISRLSELEKLLLDIKSSVSEINRLLPENVKPFFTLTQYGLREIKTFLTLARALPTELWGERHSTFDTPELDGFLKEFAVHFNEVNETHDRLKERFALDELPSTAILRKHQTILENGGFFRWFSSEWRASRKAVLSFALQSSSDKARIDVWLPETIAYSRKKDALDTLHHDKPRFGDLYKGLSTPLSRIQELRNWYRAIRNEYGYGLGERARLADALFSLGKEISYAFLGRECQTLLEQIEQIQECLHSMSTRYPGYNCFRRNIDPLSSKNGTVLDLKEALQILSASCSIILDPSTSISNLNTIYDQIFPLHEKFQDWLSLDLTRKWVPDIFPLVPPSEKELSIVESILENGAEIAETLQKSGLLESVLMSEPTRERYILLKDATTRLKNAWMEQEINRQRFIETGNVNYKAWNDAHGMELNSIITRNRLALDNPHWRELWLEYVRLRNRLSGEGLNGVIDEIENQGISAENLSEIVDLAIYSVLAEAILDQKPNLKQFRGMEHQTLRESFSKTDRLLTELQRQKIAFRISAGVKLPPSIGTGPVKNYTEQHLIRNEANKKLRHVPIRDLVKRAGKTMQELKPCFMMSPMSVAQYLTPGQCEFDLVIMDEASQIKPEDALGAIARGRQLVVVGDPEQLPPTAFFDKILGDDESDDEQLAAEQSESILDAVNNLFRKRSLLWHYRSKHESLIAFSNEQFYGNRLIVFPSIHAKSDEFGVKLTSVNGRLVNRRNSIEAKKVVEAVSQQLLKNPDESFGVVAMNAEQMAEIERELDSALENNPFLAEAYDRNRQKDEPFFIKNLENVQGDERDVIFISMTYGPENVGGKVSQRFGPINQAQGYRRLNVLITRSKKRMHVFSSMKSGDVIARSDSSRGVQALHAFLHYCETGRAPGIITDRAPDSDFEREVIRQLESHGFECEPQVGVGGFFIDIAVRDPGRPGQYLMGIECDGASYHSAKSARDRDRLRQQILEELGWRIRRIWSTDWFRNPHTQIEPIVNELNRIKTVVIEFAEPIHEIETAFSDAHIAVDVSIEGESETKAQDNLHTHLTILEKKIREKFPDTDESNRLLRPAMISAFLGYQPFNKSDFLELVPDYLRKQTDAQESANFLDEVLRLVETYA